MIVAIGPVLAPLTRAHRPGTAAQAVVVPTADPDAAHWFESRVRPVLATRCASCHSGSAPGGGLRLVSPGDLRKGGKHGPALVAGDPNASLMMKAVRHERLQMPPAGKLPEAEIEALATWIRMGAPWPQGMKAAGGRGEGGTHWAFRPVSRPAVQKVKDSAWVRNPVDAFVLAKLEKEGLHPSPEADPRTLIRRVTYDLTGLPPTSEEVEAFEHECTEQSSVVSGQWSARSPNAEHRTPNTEAAYERLVDRLLASPAYGERWGRYWLDLARYADTKDYIYAGERRFPFAYAYRDYVIRSLNEDKPYDRFLREQIAGDCLPSVSDRRDLAALGFLTLGRRFVNNRADLVDDRIDVVFRGTQGLTVTCARCHDHKFDPIPTADYYSLYGVFAASTEQTVPIGPEPEHAPGYRAYAAERSRRTLALETALDRSRAAVTERLRRGVAEYLAEVPAARKLPGEETYLVMRPDDINPVVVRRWRSYLDRRHDAIFGPWHAFESLDAASFARRAPAVARRVVRTSGKGVHPRVAALFAGSPPKGMADVAARYGALFQKPGTDAGLRAVLYGADSPALVPVRPLSEIEAYFDEETRVKLNELQGKVDAWELDSTVASPRALVLRDVVDPPQPRIFRHGNSTDPGEEVPRRLPELLGGTHRQPFRHGSGRLELAQAIASKDNPLTARVMVNRVWLGHFGKGLVTTPSDFGTRGEAPSHPALLDWLASTFVSGETEHRTPWSLKSLHRLILLSSTYRQSSEDQAAGRRVDPENTLLWRMNRRRLDFEALRDTLLTVSGQLDAHQGGRPVDLTTLPYSTRRTVYGMVDRQKLPGLFRTFDFPNPDHHNPQRYTTTSPQQALFFMNSPFAEQCARALVTRPEVAGVDGPKRIRRLYEQLYQREPTPRQLQLGLDYLNGAGGSVEGAWPRYAQALLLTNELVFVD